MHHLEKMKGASSCSAAASSATFLVFTLQNKETTVRKKPPGITRRGRHKIPIGCTKGITTLKSWSLARGHSRVPVSLVQMLPQRHEPQDSPSPAPILSSWTELRWLAPSLCHQQAAKPKFSPEKTTNLHQRVPAEDSQTIAMPAVSFFSSMQVLTWQRAVLRRCCGRNVAFLVPAENSRLHRIRQNLKACKADYPITSKEQILKCDAQAPSLHAEVGFSIARTASPEKELHANKYIRPVE